MGNSEQALVTWMIFFLFGLPLLVTLGVILAGWIQKRKTGERSDGHREEAGRPLSHVICLFLHGTFEEGRS